MVAFYNEIDPYVAQPLRNLIAAGHIAPGVVDERSIQDIRPDELTDYTQCHFFAGVGVWSLALRRAGWPDDRPVWTGSCPCQPFSAAGAGAGFADERHLEPDFAWLIDQCRPPVVFGEQVASKAADPWLDLVQVDLEAMDYAFGAVAFPSAGVGSPHIRDRTYWVAYAAGQRQHGRRASGPCDGRDAPRVKSERLCDAGGMGYADHPGKHALLRSKQNNPVENLRGGSACGSQGRMAEGDEGQLGGVRESCSGQAGPVNGLWADADWLFCRDGKWRPVEPGTFPLAHGATSRVGRLRAYGNAINAEAATQFIGAYLDATCINE